MANDLKSVRGVVEATAQNAPGRYGLRIGGEWYDGFGSCPVDRGDEVEVAYSDNGRFHNLQEVRIAEVPATETAEKSGAEDGARDSRIARAVALKCAAAVNCNNYAAADDVLETAEKFERWLRATSR